MTTKKKNLAAALLLASTLAVGGTSCHGSYGAFNGLRTWNGKVTGNKWANSAVHLGLWVIPVYPLALLGDFFIFNTIEHFTGDNPF